MVLVPLHNEKVDKVLNDDDDGDDDDDVECLPQFCNSPKYFSL